MALSAILMGGGLICSTAVAQQQQSPARSAAPAATPAAHEAAPGADRTAADGKQVDQQIDQQLTKIQQAKDNLAGDRLFVLHTACGNQFEVAVAQIAQQKSQDQKVKDLAQHLIQDHTQAMQQLQPIAQKLQLELPQGLPSHKQKELQILSGMDSKMFDQKFVSMMDEDHAKDVTCYSHVSHMAQSPDVKQFASQTLPKLQQHWQMVKQSEQAIGMPPVENDAQPAGAKIPAANR